MKATGCEISQADGKSAGVGVAAKCHIGMAKESEVAGQINLVVKLCRGYSECNQDLFIQQRFPEADRRWKWGSV